MSHKISISTANITLGQFLQLAGIIDTGGAAKWFLNEHEVLVNGTIEKRRGKKLVHHDEIKIKGIGTYIIISIKENNHKSQKG